MSDELKPCPFCGETHVPEEMTDPHYGRVFGIVCDSFVLLEWHNELQRRDQYARWNHRPIEDALHAEIEEWRKGNAVLLGAIAADEQRNIAAAEKAGIVYVGCDTPDSLADALNMLRAEYDRLTAELAQARKERDEARAEAERLRGVLDKIGNGPNDAIIMVSWRPMARAALNPEVKDA